MTHQENKNTDTDDITKNYVDKYLEKYPVTDAIENYRKKITTVTTSGFYDSDNDDEDEVQKNAVNLEKIILKKYKFQL